MFCSFYPLADKTNNERLPKPLFQGHTKIALCVFKRYENVSVDHRLLMHKKEYFEKPAGAGTEPVH